MKNSNMKNSFKMLALCLGAFFGLASLSAKAQSTEVNIYMKDGTQTVDHTDGKTYNFYDSHGPSSGPASYWDRWYNNNEEFIFTFKPASPNYKIKVAFQTFTAYTDNDGTTDPEALPDPWALRLNDDYLYVYEGEGISNAKLIASYTGNTKQAFTVMSTESTGALTFYFRSNEKYREEGWHAIVTEEAAAAPQAPFIRRSTCENEIELLPTTLKAKIYYTYTTDGSTPSNPTISSPLYTTPITIPEPLSGTMTVKAISVLNGQTTPTSSVVTASFTTDDLLTAPTMPDVDRTPENMVVMKAPQVPSGLNETYVVRYTMAVGADPEVPELRNSTLYTEPFAITEPDTRIKARTFAVSCNNWFSVVKDVTYSKINSPVPVISFTDNKITAQLNGENYDILYTTDGSEPSIAPRHGIHGGPGTMALNNIIHLGMTIKALAYKEGNANYTPSAVVSAIYAPGSDVEDYGDIVLLDDREDHSWSYYSDADSPIHSLKPADIKITYYGNGENNMTKTTGESGTEADPTSFSDDASGVKVGIGATEGQNTFIYLKTLENDNPDGSTSNNTYSYTTIPNPFQVRPVSNDFTPDPAAIAEVNLGRYTTTSVMLPTQTTSAYSVTQQIYTKDEIGRSGQINGITFYATADNGPARNLTVYLMETSKASFTDNNDWVNMTSATEVFDGTVTVTVGTTTAITFTTPFEYTGSNNLLICVYDHTGSGAAASTFYTYPTTDRSLCADGSSVYDPTNLSGVTGSPLDCNDQIDFVFDGGYTYSNSTREISSGLLTLHTPELPLNNSYNYNQTAQVYTPSEVGAAGEITSIAFHVNNLRSATRHLRIYLFYHNNVNLTSNDPSTLFNGEYIPANYQFDGTITFTSNGWTTIPLTTPFNYDGNHNLVVLVQDMTGSASSLLSVLFFTRYNTLRASSIHSRQSTTYGSGSTWPLPTSGIRTGYNNCVRFGIRTASHNPDTHLTLGNRSESAFIPVATGTNYSVSQQIVTAAEIDRGAGTIRSITLYSNGSASRSLSIYLKHTSKDRFENESDWISMKSTDLVYSGAVSFSGSTTINIPSDKYFAYDGTRNIVVCIVDNTGSTSNISFSTFTSSNSKRTLYGQSGSSIDVTTFSEIGTLSNERSQMTLNAGLKGENPRETLADADKWRGFYKWRVKRLSNGLTITSKDGSTTYSKGDMIPAETEIKFVTDKAEGNEVEFEALWAKAYVVDTRAGSSGNYYYTVTNTSVGCERNFVVLQADANTYKFGGNSGNRIANSNNRAFTVTTRYPDGSAGTSAGKIGNADVNLTADTKFENIDMAMGSNYLGGAGHNLTMGRGVTPNTANNVGVKYVRGIDTAPSSGDVNYTIRLESGNYERLQVIDSINSKTFPGKVTTRVIIGCDYDRARGDNNNLHVASSNSNYSTIYGCDKPNVFPASNRNNLTFDWIIKSGKIHENKPVGDGAGFRSVYLGNALNGANSLQYLGRRRLTMEGGVIANIAGGVDDEASTYAVNDGGWTVLIRLKGGTVRGSIYGAAAFGGAAGDRQMVCTKGTVNGWIAGGANGTQINGGTLHGSTYVYVGGETQVNSNGSTAVINRATGGNVFGAGCGYSTSSTSGQVTEGTNVVIADNAYVERGVYGGGSYGYTEATANIHILGGKIGCVSGGVNGTDYESTIIGGVFGGACQNKSGATNIIMKGGLVNGNIYGGSNANGISSGLATVNVSGGIMNNVLGGGYGENTNMAAGTNVTVSGGTLENVYGGGALGTVTGQTHVTIKEGGSVGDVYGAGLGDTGKPATITGQTFVNISGGTVNGSVYGGGEAGDVVGETPGVAATDNTYGFEDGNIPSEWTNKGFECTNNIAHGGSYSIRALNNQAPNWIITNKVVLGGSIELWARYTAYSCSLDIMVSTTDNAIGSFTPITQTDLTTTYQKLTGNLSAYAGQEGYIAIRHRSSNASGFVYVDDVRIQTPEVAAVTYDFASMVTITGGTVEGDVYGGGKLGKTTGNDVVTINGGVMKQNVFGGALGAKNEVFLAGKKTVNIMNGKIGGSVYGGSRLANDALLFNPGDFDTGSHKDDTDPCIILNISGGEIDQQVYSSGYYGNTFGSVYTFIGLKASEDAPTAYRAPGVDYEKHKLIIRGNVWAGGDWGVFDGSTGFGAPTITGNSNIYIDGTGYKTNDKDQTQEYYMKLRGSIYGCGTSFDAGKAERLLIVKNFGDDLPNRGNDKADSPFLASTEINSIQRWHKVRLDNSHIRMLGQGRVNSSNISETYSLYSIDESMYVANGSTIVMNSPANEIVSFHSVTCDDIYAVTPTYHVVSYGDAGDPTYNLTKEGMSNKLRINNGGYLKIKYYDESESKYQYGQLEGFFHLMKGVDGNGAELYARPKQSTDEGNIIDGAYNNASDGGFVSYDSGHNTYNASGGTVTAGVQVPYENHAPAPSSKAGEDYYRMWRDGGTQLKVARVLNAIADGNSTFAYKTVQVSVALPSWLSQGNYYRFDRDDEGNILVDYGDDVLTFNAANYQTSTEAPTGVPSNSEEWMSYNSGSNPPEVTGQTSSQVAAGLAKIDENKNLNFGLLVKPSSGMSGSTHIICSETSTHLASLTDVTVRYICSTPEQFDQTPTLDFVLTYSNLLSLTRTNDPILIPLVQCDGTTGEVLNRVIVSLTVATSTEITMGSKWEMYAFMDGTGTAKDRTSLRVEIPKFDVANSGQESVFTLKKAVFTETSTGGDVEVLIDNGGNVVKDTDPSHHNNYDYSYESNFGLNTFGFVMEPVVSENSSDTWRNPALSELDGATGNGSALDLKIGENGGRSPLALDFTLIYNGNVDITGYTADIPLPRVPMGTLTLTIEFDNYKNAPAEYGGVTNTDKKDSFDIVVEIYRKGQARNFYLDGDKGKNIISAESGDYPDKAYKTMNFLLNRSDFLPGDNIYIVNTITMAKETTWNGDAKQSKVNVYRYPGGHELSNGQTTMEGFDNTALTEALVDVQKDLTINGMKFDGSKSTVTAEAPMFNVENGSTLSLLSNVTLQNNNNGNGDGGAVHVDYGSTLKMNDNAKITGNVSAQGGGVFMDGKMIVSGNVQVTGNTSTTATSAPKSNVWLAPVANAGEDYRVLQVGTSDNDGFDALESGALIGVHKTDWGNGVDGYMPIVSSELGTAAYLDLPYQHPQTIIVPDIVSYPLEQYNNPNYLYWVSSWVTVQDHAPTSSSADGGVAWTQSGTIGEAGSTVTITTPNQLAWVISLVNGENGQTPNNFAGTTVNITADLDMSAHMWVPIGDETTAFAGNFNGNGHTITGVGSTVGGDFVGLFGQTNNADIHDLTVKVNFNSRADNLGTVAGLMTNGTLTNVGGAGNLTSENSSTANTIGGLVGTSTLTTIHSCYAATTIQGTSESTVGGLVGDNGSNLYNAYADVVLSEYNDASAIGGLVGNHRAGKTVENCYSIIHDENFPAFAYTNSGTIQYCYADKANGYVGTNSGTLTGPGTYGPTVLEGGKYGYEHSDQQISSNNENSYVDNGVFTASGELKGLLATLKKWVKEKNEITDNASPYYNKNFASWTRTMGSPINGDYPVHKRANMKCLGSRDGRIIEYDTDLNSLIATFNAESEGGNIYLYDVLASAVNTNTDANVRVFIQENVGILQEVDNVLNARVGITFDNSKGVAALWGKPYDWHMFSSALKAAPLGIKYHTKEDKYSGVSDYALKDLLNDDASLVVSNEIYTTSGAMDPPKTTFNKTSGNIGYFPTDSPYGPWRTDPATDEGFDFYCYSEENYHWINFKREGVASTSGSPGTPGIVDHWHEDVDANGNHKKILYYNESTFTPGKGYLMALSHSDLVQTDKASMLMADGVLNNDPTAAGISTRVSYTTTLSGSQEKFRGINLVGNPYQSYLDLTVFANVNADNLDGGNTSTFAIVDADVPGYIYYVAQSTPNLTSAPRYIHPHQGFFVGVKNNEVTSLSFTNAMRATTGGTFREDESLNYLLVNLLCYDGDGKRDYTTVEINRPELGGGRKIKGPNISDALIYARFENSDYQTLFAPEGVMEVPVRFEALHDGVFTMKWSMFNGNFHYVHLIDNLTGADIDMLNAEEYKFEGHTDDYISRFKLVFDVTGIDEPEPEPVEVPTTFAFQFGDELIVTGQGTLQLFDLNGRCLLSTKLAGEQSSVPLPNVAKGMYLLRLTGNQQTQVQKMVIK